MLAVNADDVAEAAARIESVVKRTPLIAAEAMSERTNSEVFIKAEHHQITGSFKLRGASNVAFALDRATAEAGVVTASSGNHGIAMATAARARNIPCTIYLPASAAPPKVAAIRRLGADIVTVDDVDTAAAERAGRAAAIQRGQLYVSPYNDPLIVAGQGTIAVELTSQWAEVAGRRPAGPGPDPEPKVVDAIVVAVGGGGLISGIGTWLAERWPTTTIIGASPANDAAMAASVAAGAIVEIEASPTFSDGTAGGVEPDAVTFGLCQQLVDRWETATEAEIASAVRAMIDDHHELVEGAAGVALAVAERHAAQHPGSVVIAVSCGANIGSSTLARMLDR